MHYIIVGSETELEIGKVHKLFLSDGDYKIHKMPALVVRRATKEEWLEQHPDCPVSDADCTYLYAIHVD